jgi:hypothetical protein
MAAECSLSGTKVTLEAGFNKAAKNLSKQIFPKAPKVCRPGYVNVCVHLKDVVNMTVFWDVAPCSLAENDRHLRGSSGLSL